MTDDNDKRDWYAGQALTGMLVGDKPGLEVYTPEGYAKRAFDIADAVMAERAKRYADTANQE
jgi:hypothetical protein